MTNAILTSVAARNAWRRGKLAAAFGLWLCIANGAQAGTYVIDDFESGTPFYLFAPGTPPSQMPPLVENVQTSLPVFSGIRDVSVNGGFFSTATWASAELASTPGDDGIRFSGVGGSGGVWYRDGYDGMDFDALAIADRFYVKLSEDPGADVDLIFSLQDHDGAYVFGAVTLDGGGYMELPFAAWGQDNPVQPDLHHVSGFGLHASNFGANQSVTITEFGITSVPEPASAVLLAIGGFVVLLRCRILRRGPQL
jgi:hypothetical protein